MCRVRKLLICNLTLEPSIILHSVGFALNLDDATLQIFHNGTSVHTFTGVTYGLLPPFPLPTFLSIPSHFVSQSLVFQR